MSDLSFVKQTVDSIDMYVSTDGSVSAVSGRGLAVLCGVSVSSISKLINTLTSEAITKEVPELLKPFIGKATIAITNTPAMNQYAARLIPSDCAAKIVEYYAYESKAKTATALHTFRRFAALGVDDWIKQAVGFVKPEKKELPKEVLQVMHQAVGDYILNGDIITQHVPGVGLILSAYKETPKLKLDEPFLLREYFEAKGVTDITVRQKFAHYLSGFYKGTAKLEVKKTTYHRQKKMAATNCYSLEHLPLLEAAWESFALGQ